MKAIINKVNNQMCKYISGVNYSLKKGVPVHIEVILIGNMCLIRSEDGGQTAEHKKRHRKKSSKKAKKHRSKQKRSHSQSNSDNSSDSDASSNEEEVIKRKKQKKHKKSKRRPAGSGSDNDDEVKIVAKPVKVHYVSDGEEDRNIDRNPKRLDERKRHAEPLNEDRHEYKSKWDSPKHDLERGKYRGDDRMYRDARVEGSRERSRHVQQAPPPFARQRFPDERERFDRRNDDQEYRHREQPTGPKLEKPGKSRVKSKHTFGIIYYFYIFNHFYRCTGSIPSQ